MRGQTSLSKSSKRISMARSWVQALKVMRKSRGAPPLPGGSYAFLIEQLGASTNYQFDFGVTVVPEPATAGVMGTAGGMLLLGRCRRRRP